jgi:hypothetical protein
MNFEKTSAGWDLGKEALAYENIFVEIVTLVSWRSVIQLTKVALTGSPVCRLIG